MLPETLRVQHTGSDAATYLWSEKDRIVAVLPVEQDGGVNGKDRKFLAELFAECYGLWKGLLRIIDVKGKP